MSIPEPQEPNAPPFNPLPPVVWLLAAPMILVEIALSLGQSGYVGGPAAVGWRLDLADRFGFFPRLLRAMVEAGQFPPDGVLRLVSYPFVHGSLTDMIFAVVILMAMGNFSGAVFRGWAMLVIFFAAAIAGALVYAAFPGIVAPLIGAYPAVYGLIGAYTFVLWIGLAGQGAQQFRAFTLIGALMALQLLFGVLFGGGNEWLADLGGFVAGFLVSFLVAPGGWARLRIRLRQR